MENARFFLRTTSSLFFFCRGGGGGIGLFHVIPSEIQSWTFDMEHLDHPSPSPKLRMEKWRVFLFARLDHWFFLGGGGRGVFCSMLCRPRLWLKRCNNITCQGECPNTHYLVRLVQVCLPITFCNGFG